ncbi:MBL fold metallo-hydrolase [Aliidiomarina sedimenti]|uniref:MBL fold metallo-hydrolase n=1 Tax=Aliidiomarina sedimenti TaxID=1933879 RepID=A0ABY0C0U3_9GAMM|nr:MBL fold metallo-hydrolase [Aliidiomarina sedimenti]RUO30839.1 MBL fold metallo-hydrolase [Aliidiomarina sedimenti]
MFIETIKTDGLAHLSYLVGDQEEAVVIDPRRDTRVYEQLAGEHGCRIRAIFETHRNEDFISGAPVLAKRTGATVYHGPNPDGEIAYARLLDDDFSIQLGRLRLDVLTTPGHTDDSISIVLYDTEADNSIPTAVFTGDALFIGDVGRTDFYPDRAEEVAGLLHDSLEKLVALGDHVLVYPAHGAGSVCGGGLSDREFSSIGHERLTNPALRLLGDRDAFIAHKTSEQHYMPPYFKLMEQRNLDGQAPVLQQELPALSMQQLSELNDCSWVDVRGAECFSGQHLGGTLSLPIGMIAAYAGWLLDPEKSLVLLAENEAQANTAYAHFYRLGFDNVRGYWKLNTNQWTIERGQVNQLQHITAAALASALQDGSETQILDVRKLDEWQDTGVISGAYTAYLGQLSSKLGGLRSDRPVVTVCGSGTRAVVAASLLKRQGFDQVKVLWGGMQAWQQSYSTEPYTD